MIQVQVRDIINSMDTMKLLIEKPLKARVAFRVAKLVREIDKEFELYNSERDKLIKKYGMKDENGELIIDDEGRGRLSDENIPKFNQEIQEMLDNEVELNAQPIALADLGEEEFTAIQLAQIEKFLDSEE